MYKNDIKITKGFSLTEIILVVSVLMILASVAVSSYSTHTRTARDASRIKQSQEIADAFGVYGVYKKLPQPEDSVDILVNGTLIGYQGYASEDILNKVDYYNGWLDPLDRNYKNRRKKNPFTYYITKDSKHAQLLVFLEDEESNIWLIPSVHAADYTSRTPKVSGKLLGVLTHNTLNTPVQEIDVVKSAGELDIGITTSFFTAHISDERKITGNFEVLAASTPFASCRRLSDIWKATGWDKVYRVNPDGNGYVEVYCDMDTANWWWTLIGSKASDWDQVKWTFWNLRVTIWSDANVSIPNDQTLNGFSEVMACSYDNCWKWDLSDAFKQCLRSNCYTAVEDINNLVRVKWSTGFSLWTTDRVKYNDSLNAAYMFGVYKLGNASPSLLASTQRANSNWDGIGDWDVRDKWDLYVR